MLPGSYSLAPRKRSDLSQPLSVSYGPAQVRLVSEHGKEFCLLAVSSAINHPRRDLEVGARAPVLNALADYTREARPPYDSNRCRDGQEKAKKKSAVATTPMQGVDAWPSCRNSI